MNIQRSIEEVSKRTGLDVQLIRELLDGGCTYVETATGWYFERIGK